MNKWVIGAESTTLASLSLQETPELDESSKKEILAGGNRSWKFLMHLIKSWRKLETFDAVSIKPGIKSIQKENRNQRGKNLFHANQK